MVDLRWIVYTKNYNYHGAASPLINNYLQTTGQSKASFYTLFLKYLRVQANTYFLFAQSDFYLHMRQKLSHRAALFLSKFIMHCQYVHICIVLDHGIPQSSPSSCLVYLSELVILRSLRPLVAPGRHCWSFASFGTAHQK